MINAYTMKRLNQLLQKSRDLITINMESNKWKGFQVVASGGTDTHLNRIGVDLICSLPVVWLSVML